MLAFNLKTTGKKSAIIITGLLLSTAVLEAYQMSQGQSPVSLGQSAYASSLSQSLMPGLTTDTGNHNYTAGDVQESSNWSLSGSASKTLDSPFTSQLVNDKSQAGLALFNGALDMTQKVAFSGQFSVSVESSLLVYDANAMDGGDSLGFIMTPANASQIEANLSHSVGENLGIGGLSNSIFAGRDLYSNSDVDEEIPGQTINSNRKGADGIAIRQTDATGKLLTSSYPAVGAPDAGEKSGLYSTNKITEKMSLSWTPETVNPDGTVTGSLSYELTALTGSDAGKRYQIEAQQLTVSKSLSLGVVGATGGNYSSMTYANDGSALIAGKGTGQVEVDYLDDATQQAIPGTSASQIIGNVGDSLSVIAPDAGFESRPTSYSFPAVSVPGYSYVKSDPALTLENNSQSGPIKVYYQADEQTAQFNFKWATPSSGKLPADITEQGLTDRTIAEPDLNLASDQTLTSVIGPDGKSYSSLTEALAAHTTYSATSNDFTIYVKGPAPTLPTIPSQPTVPSQPTTPSRPTSPTAPSQPTVPTLPTSPTTPTSPTQPTIAVTPTTPTQATSPQAPNTPNTPNKVRQSQPVILPDRSDDDLTPETTAPTEAETPSTSKPEPSQPSPTPQNNKKNKSSKQTSTAQKTTSHKVDQASLAAEKKEKERKALLHAIAVESAGGGGAVVGIGLSAGLWLLVERLIPGGLLALLFGWKRRKKDDEEETPSNSK
ncbi:lectin-like domain-containing protein [Lactococcus termiticola]|uniref:Uncharacterized protein n=1 Tax=Lactococcus termiticola TaxID=2169526 RepID=A0A2R5HGR8_9LACT|nr:hypothetical protein [Lactococcus termiticola]GBG97182.1 hypothetical protein NtB2_01320 [Lactococcus termiticola]